MRWPKKAEGIVWKKKRLEGSRGWKKKHRREEKLKLTQTQDQDCLHGQRDRLFHICIENETDSSASAACLKVGQPSHVKGLGDAKQCDTSQKGSSAEEQSPESAFSLAVMAHGVPKQWAPQLACLCCWLEILGEEATSLSLEN